MYLPHCHQEFGTEAHTPILHLSFHLQKGRTNSFLSGRLRGKWIIANMASPDAPGSHVAYAAAEGADG